MSNGDFRTDQWRSAWGRARSQQPQIPPQPQVPHRPAGQPSAPPDAAPSEWPRDDPANEFAESAESYRAEDQDLPGDAVAPLGVPPHDDRPELRPTDARPPWAPTPTPPSTPFSGAADDESPSIAEGASTADDHVDPPDVDDTPAPLAHRPLPRVIALANQKGGVGKTTTTINLGAALAEADHRTLIIDLDPQGNATTGLGINSRALDHSIYDVLLAEVPLDDCIESTSVRNLFIAPASLDLAGAEIELVPVMSRETRLRNAIKSVKDEYDYVLIDCPPSLGLLTVNALSAADEVMVPVQCEYYALEGLAQLERNIDLVQRNLNPDLELSSIVLVMYDGRTRLSDEVVSEVRDHYGDRVCRTVIPRNVRLSEAPSHGKPITTFDPSSRGAVMYKELAREVHRVST